MEVSRPSDSKRFVYYWLPVIFYAAAIFYQSSRAVPESIPAVAGLDKLLHLLGYALLGALFVRAYRTTRIRDRIGLIVFFSILWSSLYGFSDELHQYFVPARTASIADALADIAGSASGALAAGWAARRLGARAQHGFKSDGTAETG